MAAVSGRDLSVLSLTAHVNDPIGTHCALLGVCMTLSGFTGGDKGAQCAGPDGNQASTQ